MSTAATQRASRLKAWRLVVSIHVAVWSLTACGGGGESTGTAGTATSASQENHAAPPGVDASATDTVQFGVLGDLSAMTDGSVPQEMLDDLGLSPQRLEEIRGAQLSKSPTEPVSEAIDRAEALQTSSYDISGAWNDRMGHEVILRRGYYSGGKGFGLAKIEQKHNLTSRAVWAATAGPPTRSFVAGQKYDYFAPVAHVKCSGWWIFRTCRVTERTTIKTSVDFRTVNDGKSFGVVTSFCMGYAGRCPDWVKNAINI